MIVVIDMNLVRAEEIKDVALQSIISAYRRFTFNKEKQAELLNLFAELMKSGRMPYDIADHLVKYGANQEKLIAIDIKTMLQNGDSIVSALEGWFDPMNIAALRAAEDGGQEGFCLAMQIISRELKKEKEASSVSIAKLAMPFMYSIISFAMVFFMQTKFVPIYKEISNGNLPPPIQKLDSYAGFLMDYGVIVLVAVVGLFIYFKYLEKNLIGDFRDKIEVFKIGPWNPFGGYRLKVAAHIVASFALLKRFNFSAYAIYQVLINEGSVYQRYHVNIMRMQLPEGNENEIDSMDSGLLEQQYISLLKLYMGTDNSNIVDKLNAAAADIRKRCATRLKVNADIIYYILWAIIVNNLTIAVGVFMATNSNR